MHKLARLAPIMAQLRVKKSKWEQELMNTACEITRKAYLRVLNTIKPGRMEYEVEADVTHEFMLNRANGHAYSPIIASGASACVLHYVDNNQECKDGDLILMDFGACYANYCADLTRTIPVNGRFTERQKTVYNACLNVQKEALNMIKAGMILKEYNAEVGKVMESELKRIGLISDQDIKNQNPAWPAYKKYFMHGTGHFLGLDVHDIGNHYEPIPVGAAMTCEPGIYIKEEGIGIRIENDVVITENGLLDFMSNFPREVDEIEDAMN
jgi:Xaa-Pro aminopeptidase